jgi:biopolymer transport protein ExbB
MKIYEFLVAGGIVSIPLVAFSLLAVALIIERIKFWITIQTRQSRVITEVLKLYRSDFMVAIQRLKKNADLPLARIFLEALTLEDATPEEFRLALEAATQAEIPLLKRFNTVFQTIITASPLLGLLGTILGLMQSFSSLKLGSISSTDTAGVTGGISEALISTVMGIVVAVSTLLFANTFKAFYIRQLGLIQEYGGQLELLYRRLYEKGAKNYASSR